MPARERARERQANRRLCAAVTTSTRLAGVRAPVPQAMSISSAGIRAFVRWNAATVSRQGQSPQGLEVGGHIATYQKARRARGRGRLQPFPRQDHPGVRRPCSSSMTRPRPVSTCSAYLEGRCPPDHLTRFARRSLGGAGNGLSLVSASTLPCRSFGEFPTVSMGTDGHQLNLPSPVQPLSAHRGITDTSQQRVGALGDGETVSESGATGCPPGKSWTI